MTRADRSRASGRTGGRTGGAAPETVFPPPAAPGSSAAAELGAVAGAVRPHAARLAAAALVGAAAELSGLGLIAAAAWLIARAAQRPELAALSVAIVAVRGFALAKGALRYAERLAGHDAVLRVLAELRGRVFDALAQAAAAPGGTAASSQVTWDGMGGWASGGGRAAGRNSAGLGGRRWARRRSVRAAVPAPAGPADSSAAMTDIPGTSRWWQDDRPGGGAGQGRGRRWWRRADRHTGDPAEAEAGAGGAAGLRDGDALTRMVSDVDAVQDLLLRCLLPAAAAVACAAAGVAVCWAVLPVAAPVLAGGLLAAGVAVPVAAVAAGGRAAARAAAARRVLAVRSLDVLEGAADLAVFGAAGRFAAAAADAAGELERAERAAARVGALVTAAGALVQGCTAVAVVWTALRAGGADEVDVAVLALTSLVSLEAVLPLAGAARRLREVLPAVRRVGAVLAAAPPARSPSARPGPGDDAAALPRGPLAVELLGVRVVWPGGTVALDGVDLRVERGRRVAVVGASGAGKSTLLAVLSGAVAPAAGTVTLGGRDIALCGPERAREAVRGLTQDAHVFTGSVEANLLLARPGATRAQLCAAARRARLEEVLAALPDGWDTVVGDGGRRLSGGQRQRLLLARALLADPPVLVLDEPAEALDPAAADAVVSGLLAAPGGGTLLLVTHRLAALGSADEVVVMDRGRIVQRGRHDDLLARPGAYRDLWDAERLTSPHTP